MRGTGTGTSGGRLLLAAAAAALAALSFADGPAAAQTNGQWTWDGSIGGIYRNNESRVDGQRTNSYREGTLKLGLGLNGFIVSPLVGKFRLGLDGYLSQYNWGDGTQKDNQVGGRFDLSLFPRGAYPLRLYAAYVKPDILGTRPADALQYLGVADSVASYGGGFRVRRGALVGFEVGYDRTETKYVPTDEGTAHSTGDRAYVDWARGWSAGGVHMNLTRSTYTSSLPTRYGWDDYVALFDHSLALGRGWTWQFNATGTRRNFYYDPSPVTRTDQAQVTALLSKPDIRGRDRFDVTLGGYFFKTQDYASSGGGNISARYLWEAVPNLSVYPLVQYGYGRTSGVSETYIPGVGLGATWNLRRLPWTWFVDARGTYLWTRTVDAAAGTTDANLVGAAVSASFSHSPEGGWGEVLELNWGRNQVRTTGPPILELPDLGASLYSTGTENYYRGRFTLVKTWDGIQGNAWVEGTERLSGGSDPGTDFKADTGSAALSAVWNIFSVNGTAGLTRVIRPTDEQARFVNGGLSLSLFSSLTLSGNYGWQKTYLVPGPDFENTLSTATLAYRLGDWYLNAQGYWNDVLVPGTPTRTDRGLTVGLTRAFWGALPIFTGPQRRGVVR